MSAPLDGLEPHVPTGMKQCSDAKHQGPRLLPVEDFYVSRLKADGRQSTCKVCDRRRASTRYERGERQHVVLRDPTPEVLEEEQEEPEEKDDTERWWRFRMWHAYELAGGREMGITWNGDHVLDELEIRRWANEVAAELRAGKPLDEALQIANLEHDLGVEDLPVGVERCPSKVLGPRPLEGITERPALLSVVKLERSDAMAKHRLQTLGREDGRTLEEARFTRGPAPPSLVRPAPVARAVPREIPQCRSCMHDAHPKGPCTYGHGTATGGCTCVRSTERRVSKWRRELEARVAARGHGRGAAPADPFDCMPLAVDTWLADKEQEKGREAQARLEQAEVPVDPVTLEPLILDALRRARLTTSGLAYELDASVDDVEPALRALQLAGRVAPMRIGPKRCWSLRGEEASR